MKPPLPLAPAVLAALLWTGGCGGHGHEHAEHGSDADGHAEHDHDDPGHEHAGGDDHADGHEHADGAAEEAGGHAHEAPHGGTLVALGDHVAHVELLLDPETGGLTAWVLDGHAEGPVRIAAERLVVVATPEGGEPVRIELAPVASALTGETAGDTSQFVGAAAGLVGVERFSGTLGALTVKGLSLSDTNFHYPDGNE